MAVRLLFVPVIFLLVNFRYSYGQWSFHFISVTFATPVILKLVKRIQQLPAP